MENKIDLKKVSELLLKECGLDKNTLWENSEKFKVMKIEMKSSTRNTDQGYTSGCSDEKSVIVKCCYTIRSCIS